MSLIRTSMAILAVSGLFAIDQGHAWAQNCTSGANITSAQMNGLLNNRYACVGTSPTATWNELHSGGLVLDYKKGSGDPTDPSDTPSHPTGSYSIVGAGGPQGAGTVTYSYGAGGTYGYHIRANGSGAIPWSGTSTYSFCTTTGGQNLLVTVSGSHC